jgi:ribonuclease HII
MTRIPTFTEEKKLWRKGYKFVACLDEAGVGSLAGPVVAAAVVADIKNQNSKIKNVKLFSKWDLFRISDLGFIISEIRDSKKLSPKKREQLYKAITKNPQMKWGIGVVSEKIIDRINIKNAAELAMEKAIKKIQNAKCRMQNDNSKFKIDYLIIDGNRVKNGFLRKIKYKLIVKADEKVFSCAAASIIAKVTRDRIMRKLHKKYPQYLFDIHKGYGTKLHLARLKKFGPSSIHRKSFEPVATCIRNLKT